MMRRCILYLVGIVLLFSGPLFAQDSNEPENKEDIKPQASFDSLEYDFGQIEEGAVVKHDFIIENKGTANLVVKELIARCGCTVSSTDTEVIVPGAKGTIHVEFDTSGFSGQKTKTVRVVTNDIEHPASILTIKGTVAPEVFVEPRWIAFESVAQGMLKNNPKKILIAKVAENSKVSLSGYKSYSEKLVLKELERSKKLLKLEISIAPDAPIGDLRERIAVRFTGGKRTSINVPVFGHISSNMRLTPAVVSFGVIKKGVVLKKEVKLENFGPKEVEVVTVTGDHPSLTASFKVVKPGRIYSIHVEVDSDKLKSDLRSSVKIKISDQGQKPLSLHVKGVLPPEL